MGGCRAFQREHGCRNAIPLCQSPYTFSTSLTLQKFAHRPPLAGTPATLPWPVSPSPSAPGPANLENSAAMRRPRPHKVTTASHNPTPSKPPRLSATTTPTRQQTTPPLSRQRPLFSLASGTPCRTVRPAHRRCRAAVSPSAPAPLDYRTFGPKRRSNTESGMCPNVSTRCALRYIRILSLNALVFTTCFLYAMCP